jgi:hypothetical protein
MRSFGPVGHPSPLGWIKEVQHWYAVYGHPDGVTDRPWFAVDEVTGLVYPSRDGSPATFSGDPCLRLVGNLVYPVGSATDDERPWFEIRGSCVYSTDAHPRGEALAPWYQMR